MPLVVYELLAYHADILCLQEVDWYIFDSLYKPILESQGYQGIFNCKKSGQQEGCAMFWLKDRLECIENDWVGISETVLNKHTDDWCEHETLLQQLPHLINRFEQLGQTLQLAKFVDKRNRNRGLMVGNTHLYYHPLGDHIRVLQTYGVCRKMHEWQRKQPDFSVVLCGDLNSDPKSGAFQFLTTGELQSSSSSWKNLLVHPPLPRKGSNDSTDTEKCALPPLLTFASDFQTLSPSCLPLFTHCIPEFSGTLDYIFTTSSLACVAFAPMPEEPIFLPNTGVPSDHISLVADYEWR
jgi:2',5'-phosphodiesterase